MTKYERCRLALEAQGTGQMKAFGQSMKPILVSGSLLTFSRQPTYEIDDIVFCKVRGRFIDAHKITKIDKNKGYLIANNHGYENGWTHQIYGKVTQAEFPDGTIKEFK